MRNLAWACTLVTTLGLGCGGPSKPTDATAGKPADSSGGKPADASGAASDDCAVVGEKSRPVLARMMGEAGGGDVDGAVTALVEKCRAEPRMREDAVFACTLAAADDVAVAACWQTGVKQYAAASGLVDAKAHLHLMATRAQQYYMERADLPPGTAPLTPASPCCGREAALCPVDAALWDAEPWATLYFKVDEPGRFQYAFESDGDTFTGHAVGDPECDGTPVSLRFQITRATIDRDPEITIDP